MTCRSVRFPYALSALVAVLVAVVFVTVARAQDRDDDARGDDAPMTFEEWQRREEAAFDAYLDAQDAAFDAFLRRQWARVDVDAAPARPDLGPKPAVTPVATPAAPAPDETAAPDEAAPDVEPTLADADAAPEAEPSEPSAAPDETAAPAEEERAEEPRAEEASEDAVSMAYFGTAVGLPALPTDLPRLRQRPDADAIRTHWRALERTRPLAPVLDVLARQRATLGLSDWGYVLLLRDAARRTYGLPPATTGRERFENDEALFVWYALLEAGYAARIGYNSGRVYLLLPSRERLYDLPQLRIDGERHYVMTLEGAPASLGRLRTYEGQHPEATRRLSFHVPAAPRLQPRPATRSFAFTYDGTRYAFDVAYDRAVIDRLARHPRAELAVPLSAGVSPTAEASLVKALAPIVEGKTELEAANLLLRFVQVGFRYKRDQDQFGAERYLFAEEVLAMPYSDCEDRAVLYAYLVRRLLGLDAVALWYPRHVNTAIRFTERVEGAAVRHDGARYVVADPTYIGAGVGRLMPDLAGHTPDVIVPRAFDAETAPRLGDAR